MSILVASEYPENLQSALQPYGWIASGSARNAAAVTALLAAQPWQAAVVDVMLWDGLDEMVAEVSTTPVTVVACIPLDLDAGVQQQLQQRLGPQLFAVVGWDGHKLHGELGQLPDPVPAAPPVSGVQGFGPSPAPVPIPQAVPPVTPVTPVGPAVPRAPLPAGPPAGGWKCVAIWSLEGGAGKTTTALALAWACADRGIPVLVVSLSAPDMVPIYTGLDPVPGLLEWQNRDGTAEALTQVLRYDGRVGHVTGPQQPSELIEFVLRLGTPQVPGLPELVTLGALAGHSLVILDCGAAELAGPALETAMELVIPVSCSFRGAVLLVRALELSARQQLKSITVLLNRVRAGGMEPTQFQTMIRKAEPATMPQNWVIVKDDLAGIEGQHNVGGQPHRSSATLRAAAEALQELVYPLGVPAPSAPPRRGLFGRRR